MRKFLLVILGVMLFLPVFSQKERGYVYLKNGTILRGKYQMDSAGKVTIESAGNVWVFHPEEVDRVVPRDHLKSSEGGVTGSVFPLFFRTELGFLLGNPDNSQPAPFTLTGMVNYRLNSHFSGGAGLGAEFLKETYMPLFFNFEYALKSSLVSPYLFMKAGYMIPLEESREVYHEVWPTWNSFWPGPAHANQTLDPEGGVLANAGIGYSVMFSSGFGMSLAFGYQFHRLGYSGGKDYRLEIDYNRLTMKLGFIF